MAVLMLTTFFVDILLNSKPSSSFRLNWMNYEFSKRGLLLIQHKTEYYNRANNNNIQVVVFFLSCSVLSKEFLLPCYCKLWIRTEELQNRYKPIYAVEKSLQALVYIHYRSHDWFLLWGIFNQTLNIIFFLAGLL